MTETVYLFSTDFSDVPVLQADNIQVSGMDSPNGIAGHLEIVNNSCKATIYSTDTATLGGIRSECAFTKSSIGTENWYSWQTFINEADWVNGSSGICSIMQVHPLDSLTTAVNFLLVVDANQLKAYVPSLDPPSESTAYKIIPLIDFSYNRWHTFCLHAYWYDNDVGFMDLIYDQQMLLRIFRRGTAYTADTPYPKLGMYDINHTNQFGNYRSIYFKNMNLWTGTGYSYTDVLGTGIVPRPVFISA